MKIYTVVFEDDDCGSVSAVASFSNYIHAENRMMSEFSKHMQDVKDVYQCEFTFGKECGKTPYVGVYNSYWSIWRILTSEMGDE